jgi:two-component system sensor histidine kinase QseC
VIGRPGSLQGRLLVLVLGIVTAVWLGAAVLTWFDARHELDELLDGHLAQAAALLVVQQAAEVEEGGQAVEAPALHPYAPKVAFQVFHEGQLVTRSANAPMVPMAQPGQAFDRGFANVQIDGADWRVFTAQGAESDVRAYVGERSASRAEILWAVLRSVLWPMVLGLPLLGLAAAWAVGRGTAPLRQLGLVLTQREPQALGPLAMSHPPTEMRPMLDALNGLLARIGTLLQSERRFTADAAHELRTPIAGIRAQAQVALAESDVGRRSHALRLTLEGCDRAARLVDQMLTLSRLDAATGAMPALQPVDLCAVARAVVAEVAPVSLAKEQTLALDADGPCVLPGNEMLLSVLVRNLLDNAVRYSPPQARIVVAVECEATRRGDVVLRIEDSGPGLEPADRARLGERFFRVLGSGESGSGLGWSIVRRIAAAHGLGVQVDRSEALGGLRVQLSWEEAARRGSR